MKRIITLIIFLVSTFCTQSLMADRGRSYERNQHKSNYKKFYKKSHPVFVRENRFKKRYHKYRQPVNKTIIEKHYHSPSRVEYRTVRPLPQLDVIIPVGGVLFRASL